MVNCFRSKMDLIVNMDLKIVLLCLGLLSCGQSYQEQLVSPITPRSLVNYSGALFNIPIGTYPGVTYPATKWVVRQWIYVTSYTGFGIYLAYISDPYVYGVVYVADDEVILMAPGNSDVATFEFQYSKWIFSALGTNGDGQLFFVLIFRGDSAFSLTVADSPSLTTTSIYNGSLSAEGFTVRD